jgi:hypothetical protein
MRPSATAKCRRGKHLTVDWTQDGFVVELKDGATGNELGAEPVVVPARLSRYYAVARMFRDRTNTHEVSRSALPRALRIIHALAVALEQDGHRLQCIVPTSTDGYGRSAYKPKHDGQLTAAINGHQLRLRLWETGVGLRGATKTAAWTSALITSPCDRRPTTRARPGS